MEKILIIDCETTNSLDDALVYDWRNSYSSRKDSRKGEKKMVIGIGAIIAELIVIGIGIYVLIDMFK